MTVKSIAIVANESKPGVDQLRSEISALLDERGVAVDNDAPEMVLSLGGDGTMLRAAQVAHSADVPLLGVNLGVLGYLTDVEAAHARSAVEKILEGQYEIEERMMLSCEVGGNQKEGARVALNEVLVERSTGHRLVRLSVRIGGESLAAFNADGVLVATPTGSTAYALSAGGPIVSPRAECLVVVPVNAHMIFSRPFVLAPDETVEIAVGDSRQMAAVSLDGDTWTEIPGGETVTVARDPRRLRLARVSGLGFIERLRIKLNLPR